MNKELVTYQTYESPKKTGGVIVGVTLLTVGLAILILYLVRESRKPDEEELRRLINGEPVPVSQAEATTVSGLLDDLFAFGSGGGGEKAGAGCTISVACNYDSNATIADNASCDFESCYSGTQEIRSLCTTRHTDNQGILNQNNYNYCVERNFPTLNAQEGDVVILPPLTARYE